MQLYGTKLVSAALKPATGSTQNGAVRRRHACRQRLVLERILGSERRRVGEKHHREAEEEGDNRLVDGLAARERVGDAVGDRKDVEGADEREREEVADDLIAAGRGAGVDVDVDMRDMSMTELKIR